MGVNSQKNIFINCVNNKFGFIQPDMKAMASISLLFLFFLSACAAIQVERNDVFPFRAEFDLKGSIKGLEAGIAGAMLIHSSDNAVAQVYVTGGLAAYTIRIENRQIIVSDTWGRNLHDIKIPFNGLAGMLAGVAPSGFACSRKLKNGGIKINYLWGSIVLDKDYVPLNIHVNSDEIIDASFLRKEDGMVLMINRGSDNFLMHIKVIEGGRWTDAYSEMQDVRKENNME